MIFTTDLSRHDGGRVGGGLTVPFPYFFDCGCGAGSLDGGTIALSFGMSLLSSGIFAA